MGGDTVIQQQPQASYSESLRESLQAQVDLAPQLFQAEASQQYGRPAYAQLETDILRDTLLGGERFVPEAGQEAAYAQMQQAGAPMTRKATEAELVGDLFDSGDPEAGWEWVGGSREAGGNMLQRTGGVPTGTVTEAEGGATFTAPRSATAFDVGTESDKWAAYVNLNPDLKSWWEDPTVGSDQQALYQGDIAAFGKAHYESSGKNENRLIPEIGKTYDTATGAEYIPESLSGTITREDGLLSLLGGEGRQTFGTGTVEQEFVTRPATEADVSSGQARFVGQEISEGRMRDGQMIGETRDVLGSEQRRAGYSPEGEFMGLAQYGSDISEQAARRQRTADIRDVQALGGIATQALREADPLSSELLGQMGTQAKTTMGQIQRQATQADVDAGRAETVGETIFDQYGGLLGTLQGEAAADLAAGRGLSDRQRREAEQGARAGWEARGMIRDPGAVVGEVESVMEARGLEEAKRRAFAQQVLAQEAARRGEGRALTQATMGASRAMTADPFMAILGRPSGASQQIAQQGLGSAGYGLTAAPGVTVSPESGLSFMLGQQQNIANLQAAQASADATRTAGMWSGIGSAVGGLCWVAREVYGEDNPKWMQFRSWLVNKAPDWFHEWYLTYGEVVAEWLRDKPDLKARIKIFMDSKLEA